MPDIGQRLSEALEDLLVVARDWRILARPTTESNPLAPLAAVLEALEEPGRLRSAKCPQDYLSLWKQFCRGEATELSPRAVRSLCWEAAVVVDPRFPAVLSRLDGLRPRLVQALV